MVSVTKFFHDKLVYSRRMKRLTELIAPLLEYSKNILDVGCGDGKIDHYLLKRNKKIHIQGIDVLVRPKTYIDVKAYDGKTIPYADQSFDTVMIIDVLHHTNEPDAVIGELARVSSHYIIIKDHVKRGNLSCLKLRLMDYVGNAHYHVRLPWNYQTAGQWKRMFKNNSLKIVFLQRDLHLYKGIFHLLFDGNLHFIAVLKKDKEGCET